MLFISSYHLFNIWQHFQLSVCDPAFITLSSEVLKPSLNCLSTRIRFHWDAIESWIKPRAVEKHFFSLWGLNHSSPCVVRPPYSRGSESQCVRRMPHFVKTLCLKWFSWSWEGFKRGWEELGEVFLVYNVFSAQQWAFLLCAFLLGGKRGGFLDRVLAWLILEGALRLSWLYVLHTRKKQSGKRSFIFYTCVRSWTTNLIKQHLNPDFLNLIYKFGMRPHSDTSKWFLGSNFMPLEFLPAGN